MRTRAISAGFTALILAVVLLVMPAMATEHADSPEDSICDTYVTVDQQECTIDVHPTGRSISWVTFEGVEGTGSALFTFINGGYVDVTVVHEPGQDEGTDVKKRFEVQPCPTTTTPTRYGPP